MIWVIVIGCGPNDHVGDDVGMVYRLINLSLFFLLWSPSITDDDDFLFNVEDTT